MNNWAKLSSFLHADNRGIHILVPILLRKTRTLDSASSQERKCKAASVIKLTSFHKWGFWRSRNSFCRWVWVLKQLTENHFDSSDHTGLKHPPFWAPHKDNTVQIMEESGKSSEQTSANLTWFAFSLKCWQKIHLLGILRFVCICN